MGRPDAKGLKVPSGLIKAGDRPGHIPTDTRTDRRASASVVRSAKGETDPVGIDPKGPVCPSYGSRDKPPYCPGPGLTARGRGQRERLILHTGPGTFTGIFLTGTGIMRPNPISTTTTSYGTMGLKVGEMGLSRPYVLPMLI